MSLTAEIQSLAGRVLGDPQSSADARSLAAHVLGIDLRPALPIPGGGGDRIMKAARDQYREDDGAS